MGKVLNLLERGLGLGASISFPFTPFGIFWTCGVGSVLLDLDHLTEIFVPDLPLRGVHKIGVFVVVYLICLTFSLVTGFLLEAFLVRRLMGRIR